MVNEDKNNIYQDFESNLDDDNKIESISYASLVYPLMFSSFLGLGTNIILKISSIDLYISGIIGTIIGLIPLLLFFYIDKNSGENNIITLHKNIFGKLFGGMINIVLNLIVLFFTTVIVYNLIAFLDTQYLSESAYLYIGILILIPVVYAASKDIAKISRVAQITFIINIAFFILSFFGICEYIKIDNVRPILENGIKNPLLGGVIYAMFSSLPIFLLSIISNKFMKTKKNKYKKVTIMYFITNFIIILMLFTTASIHGINIMNMYKYPEYMVLKRFTLFSIVERLETILAMQFMFSIIMFLIICFHFIIKSVDKILPKQKDTQIYPYILMVIVLAITSIYLINSTKTYEFMQRIVPYVFGIGIFSIMILDSVAIFIRNFKILKKKK